MSVSSHEHVVLLIYIFPQSSSTRFAEELNQSHFTIYLHTLKERQHRSWLCHFLKRFYLFIFREGKGEWREGEKHQCVVASCVPPTGDLVRNPGMCPVWNLNQQPFGPQPALNPLSHTNQGCFAVSFMHLTLRKKHKEDYMKVGGSNLGFGLQDN